MALHRVLAQPRSRRDGRIAEAVGDQLQHFALRASLSAARFGALRRRVAVRDAARVASTDSTQRALEPVKSKSLRARRNAAPSPPTDRRQTDETSMSSGLCGVGDPAGDMDGKPGHRFAVEFHFAGMNGLGERAGPVPSPRRAAPPRCAPPCWPVDAQAGMRLAIEAAGLSAGSGARASSAVLRNCAAQLSPFAVAEPGQPAASGAMIRATRRAASMRRLAGCGRAPVRNSSTISATRSTSPVQIG